MQQCKHVRVYVICLCKRLPGSLMLNPLKMSRSTVCMTVMYRGKTDQPKSVYQAGSTSTFEPGIHRFMNSAISRQEPVPDKDCTAATRLSAIALLLSPYASLMDTWLKSFRPPIGRYLQAHCCSNQLEPLMMYAELHTCSTVSHRPDSNSQDLSLCHAYISACSHTGGGTEVAKLSGLVCSKWPVVKQE